jgi:hypothetical protein
VEHNAIYITTISIILTLLAYWCIYLDVENLVGVEELCLLGYNAVLSVESYPTFRRNISPPNLELKNKPRNKPA